MNTLATSPAAQPTEVRAGISEKKFFESMKHMFASSFSLLGELMQNARRAGATAVEFKFDASQKDLDILDNGSGIEDFATLVSLCESGWKENVVLSDRPFGMGFFSLFFACEEVIVRSKGMIMRATLADITNKRPIEVNVDDERQCAATRITLHNLDSALLAKAQSRAKEYEIERKLKQFAMGFPIKVSFNGSTLESPHAVSNLKHATSQFGEVHIAHVHSDDEAHMLQSSLTPILYLQGLPINGFVERKAMVVVHLDSQLFVPQMPDRARLYDGEKQLEALRVQIRQLVAQFLVEKKSTMDSKAFAETYWGLSKQFGVKHLLNDIPWIPANELVRISSLECGQVSTYDIDLPRDQTLIAREDIFNGKYVVWQNLDRDALASEFNGALLNVAIHQQICLLSETINLDATHWIYDVADATDMTVDVTPTATIDTVVTYVGPHEVEIRLVDKVAVKVTSTVDAFEPIEITHSDDWVNVMEKNVRNEMDPVVYVAGGCMYSEDAADIFDSFRDGFEVLDEDEQTEVKNAWAAKVAGVRGQGLPQVIANAIRSISLPLNEKHLGQLVLTTSQQPYYDFSKSHGPQGRLAVFDIERSDFWQSLAEQISANKEALKGEALKAMFSTLAGATSLEDTPDDTKPVFAV